MSTIFLDGRMYKVKAQTIEALAPGAFEARGVFETMLGLGSLVLYLPLHLKRMCRGLKCLGLQAPSIGPAAVQEVLRRNQLACARVRIMVWQEGRRVHGMVSALPYQIPGRKIFRACLIKTNRPAGARWAEVKSLDYAIFAQAYAQARSQGFDEALLINQKGNIFEASRANIFWTEGRALFTPPLTSGCLNGITRQQVMRQARRFRIPVKEKNLTPQMLQASDSAFLTNSLMGIKPLDIHLG